MTLEAIKEPQLCSPVSILETPEVHKTCERKNAYGSEEENDAIVREYMASFDDVSDLHIA